MLPAECGDKASPSSFPESTFLGPTGQSVPVSLNHQVGRLACAHTHTFTLTPPRLKCLHSVQGRDSSSELLIRFPSGLFRDTSLSVSNLSVQLQSPLSGKELFVQAASILLSLPPSLSWQWHKNTVL